MQQSATVFVSVRDGDDTPLWQALGKGGGPMAVRALRAVDGGIQLQLSGLELHAEDEVVIDPAPLPAPQASARLLLSGGYCSASMLAGLCQWLAERAQLVDVALVASLTDAQAPYGAIQLLLADVAFSSEQLLARPEAQIMDLNLLPLMPKLAQPGLLLMDMDSTAIQIECIDEIAKLAGVGEQVAEVTELAMQGKLDFAESLRARVATLNGQPESILAQVAAAIPLTPGLEPLIAALHRRNWLVGIVSGGFTYFTSRLERQLGLDFTLANTMGIDHGVLTGSVSGEIVDASVKERTLRQWAERQQIPLAQCVAAGDGANDLKMLAAAGLGVAFHAKPVVRAQAAAAINRGGIEAIYYMLADADDLL